MLADIKTLFTFVRSIRHKTKNKTDENYNDSKTN